MVKKLVRCTLCERMYRKPLREAPDYLEVCPECVRREKERIAAMEKTFDEPLHSRA